MGEVKRVASNLMQMLDGAQKEAQSLAGIMDELQSYLEEESQTIVEGNLDRLSSRIRSEAAKITGGSVVVLVSPEGRVTVDKTYSDEDSDPWLKRLKSQDNSELKRSKRCFASHDACARAHRRVTDRFDRFDRFKGVKRGGGSRRWPRNAVPPRAFRPFRELNIGGLFDG